MVGLGGRAVAGSRERGARRARARAGRAPGARRAPLGLRPAVRLGDARRVGEEEEAAGGGVGREGGGGAHPGPRWGCGRPRAPGGAQERGCRGTARPRAVRRSAVVCRSAVDWGFFWGAAAVSGRAHDPRARHFVKLVGWMHWLSV